MPIKFKCKHCGEVLNVSSKYAGKMGKCKKCRKPVRAPIPEALPDEEPVRKYTSPRRGKTGLLAELKAHPLWCVAGAFAFIVLVGAVILLNISGKTDKTDLPLIDSVAGDSGMTETEYSQDIRLNGADLGPEKKVEPESSITSGPDDNIIAANITEEELTSLPVWAQIILDQELFPDGETWKTAEDAFEYKCSLDPSIRNNPKQLQSVETLSYSLTPLEPKVLIDKYGPARITYKYTEGINWHRYGLISFGLEGGDTNFSKIQAQVELFTGGFVETAKNSGISRIESTEILRSRVVIINSYTKTVGFSFKGCGPYFLDPNDRKVLTLPAGSYSIDVTPEDKNTVPVTAAACDGTLWNIGSNPNDPELPHLFVEADQDTSGSQEDSTTVYMTLVNKHTAALSVQVGYDGTYYKLKPDQQQVMRLRKKKHLVCIESEDGRSAYQVTQASENIAWDVKAAPDERNFCIDVNDNPAIPEQFPEADMPAQPIAGSFDPNQPVGQVQVFEGHSDTVSNVTFSPDGSKVLSCGGDRDKTIRLWDTGAKTELQCFEESQQSITKLAFCSDGRHAWSYNSADYSACYFDLQTGEELGGFRQHICNSHTAAFSPSAQHILIADKALFLWELETGELSLSFKPQQESDSTGKIMEIALSPDISPDEQYVLIGFDSGNLELWPLDKENSEITRIHRLSGHKAWINSLDFSPDGELAVSGGGYCARENSSEKSLEKRLGSKPVDCTVRVWDLNSGQQKACFDGHQMPVTTVAFSPDGQRVLSGGYDKTVRLWDIGSSKELLCSSEHTGPVNSVAFSPDGRLAVSAGDDQTVRLWKLPEPVEVAKEDIDEDGAATPESDTSNRSEPRDEQLLIIGRSEITQVAPFVQITGQGVIIWPLYNKALGVVEANGEDFLWVIARVVQSGVKKTVPEMSIRDENNNEVGSLYAWVDAANYKVPAYLYVPFIPIVSFVDKANDIKIMISELPDQKSKDLLYSLADGSIFKGRYRDRYVLLIFKGKYGSVEGFYLDGTNIHLPLRQSQRRLRRSTPLRTPAPRIGTSRQSINRDNTRSELEGARGRSGRTSSRERTR